MIRLIPKVILRRMPERWRDRLDSWQFWVGVAYFGLACCVVGLYFVNSRTQREEAIRISTARAAAQAQERRCIESRPVLMKVNRFFEGSQDLAATLVENSQANLAATPIDDPLRPTRVKNLRRLAAAYRKVLDVDDFPVPTVDQCRGRR